MSALISASDITQQSGALPFRKKREKNTIYLNNFLFNFFSLEPKSREVKFSALFF